jgi:spore coat polysaccharide biosynthesis protein SpsF (cytidylyltransferase family)
MVGVFITARLGSTRLSEKHLIEVNEKPLIQWLVERFSFAFKEKIDKKELKIFITTSTKPENEKFELLFDKKEVEVFFGSDENIPLRHLECAIENSIDYIISIDGDDILSSTEAAKVVISKLMSGSKMVQTIGLPLGMNCSGYTKDFLEESLSSFVSSKLETGWGKIFDKNMIDVIRVFNIQSAEKIRLTLDYQPDAHFFEKIISNIDVLNISDSSLINSIVSNNWSQINNHLNDVYWANFNKRKEEEHKNF